MIVYLIFIKFLCLFVSPKTKNLFASDQQTTRSKLSKIPYQQGILRIRPSKKLKITFTESYRNISFCPSSNNTPSIPPYYLGSKRKSLTEEKSDDGLPASIGDDYFFNTSVIDGVLKKIDASDGNFSMNNHTISQHDFDFNNGDVSS